MYMLFHCISGNMESYSRVPDMYWEAKEVEEVDRRWQVILIVACAGASYPRIRRQICWWIRWRIRWHIRRQIRRQIRWRTRRHIGV